MSLEQDRLAVSDQLLDFERTHYALDAVILRRVRPAHLRHVIAVLFRDICSHLTLALGDAVEDLLN